MVPAAGRERTMERPAETPGGNSPPDCCIWIGSSPSPLDTKKENPRSGFSFLVPVTGLEPVRCRQRWILSPEKYLEARCNRWKLIETCNRKNICKSTTISIPSKNSAPEVHRRLCMKKRS